MPVGVRRYQLRERDPRGQRRQRTQQREAFETRFAALASEPGHKEVVFCSDGVETEGLRLFGNRTRRGKVRQRQHHTTLDRLHHIRLPSPWENGLLSVVCPLLSVTCCPRTSAAGCSRGVGAP